MIVNVTTKARRELDEIGDYISRDDPHRAVSFVRELFDRCMSLSEQTRRFPIAFRWHGRVVHKMAHHDYLIFYYIRRDEVQVTHVIHSARNWDRLARR